MIVKINIERLPVEHYTTDYIQALCKINELIDAVNTLQATCMTYPTSAEKKRVECGRASQGSLEGLGQDEVNDFGVNNPNVGSSPTPGNIKDPKLAKSVERVQGFMDRKNQAPYIELSSLRHWDYIKQVLTEKGLI